MILQALNQYYDRLANDGEQDIAPFGFSRQKISFCIVLERDGTLAQFQSEVSEVVKGRSLPQSIIVPGQSKPPGAGINPCLLWDNATYLLGQKHEDHDAAWAAKRFQAFRDRHLALEKEIADEGFSAVCNFLRNWQPEQIEAHSELAEMTGSFGVFRLRNVEGYVHDRPAVRSWWQKQIGGLDEEALQGFCLVKGEKMPLARLNEPKIKGVADTQSAGALLVSFNLDAFESYGKIQGYNAPISQVAAFQYATALNKLLADSGRRKLIGDATTVFWTETPTPEERVIPSLFAGGLPTALQTEDKELVDRIRSFLDCLRQGKPDELAGKLDSPETRYFILGLSPNASRISVRFWMTGIVRELAQRLSEHVRALDIIGLDGSPPVVQELLRETAPPKGGYPDTGKIPSPLATGLMQAVLKGLPYPIAFYAAILRRVRCEQFVSREKRNDWRRAMAVRAAAIKAVLIRNFRKEIAVSLDPQRPEVAYHLGRWFAMLEKIQRDALGENLNSTIKDRFFSAASATPSVVFPRLIRLCQHHLNKVEATGLRIMREKQVQEIAAQVNAFPRQQSLEDQGLFHLGYYHQVQSLYTRKSNGQNNETLNKESE